MLKTLLYSIISSSIAFTTTIILSSILLNNNFNITNLVSKSLTSIGLGISMGFVCGIIHYFLK